jgi:hypothetical protein
VEEIAAIIGRASLGDVIDGNEDLARWLEVVDAWLDVDPAYLEDDHPRHAEAADAHDALCAATQGVWAKPVHSFADVILRFVVAGYWNTAGHLDYLPYPDDVIARADGRRPLAIRRAADHELMARSAWRRGDLLYRRQQEQLM